MCDFNYWELEQIDSMFDTLYSNIPSGESPDRLSGNVVTWMIGLIMRLCKGLVVGDFLRRVFGKGRLRLQKELHSLCGQQHGGKS